MHRLSYRAVVLLVALTLPLSGIAQSSHERFQFNRDIHVEQNDKTGDVTCINCSAYIRGEVAGDLFVMNGRVVLEQGAQVTGDIATLIGDVRLDDGAKIGGDVAAIGGTVHRSPQATIVGDVTSMAGGGWVLLALLVPLLVLIGFVALIVWLIRRIRKPDPVPGAMQRV